MSPESDLWRSGEGKTAAQKGHPQGGAGAGQEGGDPARAPGLSSLAPKRLRRRPPVARLGPSNLDLPRLETSRWSRKTRIEFSSRPLWAKPLALYPSAFSSVKWGTTASPHLGCGEDADSRRSVNGAPQTRARAPDHPPPHLEPAPGKSWLLLCGSWRG